MAALSFGDAEVNYSTDGSAWTDISAESNKVTVSGGERMIGRFFNFTLDYPLLSAGKRDELEITTAALYDESGTFYEAARAAFEAKSAFYIQWSPAGGGTGDFQFTSTEGIIKSPVYPQGEAESPDPIAVEVVIVVAGIVKSVIT